jgi:hypothetical protein
MSVHEPGLDRHEWESELESVEQALRDAPYDALPGLGDLVERMLAERGYQLGDPVAGEGEEREVVDQYRSAREIADRCERGEDVDPGDVAAAVDGFRAVYDHLITAREAP